MFERQHTSLFTKKAIAGLLDSAGMSMAGQTTSGPSSLPGGVQPTFNLDMWDMGAGEANIIPNIPDNVSPTFTRATTATTVLSNGLIASVATGVARSYYDPTSLTYLGYLAEGARTNLCLQSEDLATTWSVVDTTITVNATTAPDGAATADLCTEGTAGSANVSQAITATADVTHTFSMWLKRGNTDWVRLSIQENTASANRCDAWFNLATGAAGSVANAGTGTSAASSIKAYPDGWYRCVVSGNAGNAATSIYAFSGSASADAITTRVNNATRYEWGAQFENNVAFASSYIPTTTAAVARNADVLTYPTTGWLNAAAGTFLVQAQVSSLQVGLSLAQVSDGTVNERINILLGATGVGSVFTVDGGVTQTNFSTANTTSANTSFSLAAAYAVNDFAVALDGGTVATDTSGTLPTVTTLGVGNNNGASQPFGPILRVQFYPVRLPNASLQVLTA